MYFAKEEQVGKGKNPLHRKAGPSSPISTQKQVNMATLKPDETARMDYSYEVVMGEIDADRKVIRELQKVSATSTTLFERAFLYSSRFFWATFWSSSGGLSWPSPTSIASTSSTLFCTLPSGLLTSLLCPRFELYLSPSSFLPSSCSAPLVCAFRKLTSREMKSR